MDGELVRLLGGLEAAHRLGTADTPGIEPDDVEATLELMAPGLAVAPHGADPRGARPARIDEQTADPAFLVGGGNPSDRELDLGAQRIVVVERNVQQRDSAVGGALSPSHCCHTICETAAGSAVRPLANPAVHPTADQMTVVDAAMTTSPPNRDRINSESPLESGPARHSTRRRGLQQ